MLGVWGAGADLKPRTVCGRFVSVFMAFISKRPIATKRNRFNVLERGGRERDRQRQGNN